MSRPEYLVAYYPYTKDVSRYYKVTGDTEKYWKCKVDASGDTILINKRTLRLRGSDIQYHSWTKEELTNYLYRVKLEKAVSKIEPRKLSVKQLESIIKKRKNKMTYEREKVVTPVTADDVSQRAILKGIFGYFANDIESLQTAVVHEKTSGRCYYGRLTQVRSRDKRDRFVLDRGELIFTLFYPTDTTLNTLRY